MDVLVLTGSKHGSTEAIGQAIADRLRERGHQAVAQVPGDHPADVDRYDAFVVGSAIYIGHWVSGAREFLHEHRDLLASRPTWLFSSGPLDGSPTDAEPEDVAAVAASIGARGHEVFGGALDKHELSLGERATVRAVHAPYGDFRSWDQVHAWADQIATELTAIEGPAIEGLPDPT